MKKLLYLAVAAIAALSSCSNDDVIVNENENENQKVEAPVFTATIEGEAETRTTLVQNTTTGKYTKVNWEESGEEVKMLFGNSSYTVISLPVYQVTRSAEDASTATLTIKEGETYNEAANFLFAAIYPASIVTDDMKYIFPATQKYKGDGKIGFAPMFSVNPNSLSDSSLPQTLNFKNACALLAITIPYTEMTSVHSITVSSDLQMNGQMNLDMGGYFKFNSPSNPGSGENQVTLDCYSHNNANVAIPEGGSKTFYVSIVPRESVEDAPYLKYLQIAVTDGNITKTMRTKTFEGTKTSGIEIKPNKIYPINFSGSLFAVRFTAKQAGSSVGIKKTDSDKADIEFQYSTDNGTTWTDYTPTSAGTAVTLTNIGDEICFRRKGNGGTALNGFSFTGSGNIAVSGNIMSLLSNDGSVVALPADDAFNSLFFENQALTDASQLSLPATTLEYGCYDSMFRDCSNLTSAPELPATTLATCCYQYMFSGCSSLTPAPALPATTLTYRCYSNMFCGCSSLTSAPELPATTLINGCYDSMFRDCSNLISAPELPATTLVDRCYKCMFGGCVALESVKIYAIVVEDPDEGDESGALYKWFNVENEEESKTAGYNLIKDDNTPIIHVTQELRNKFTGLSLDGNKVVSSGGSCSTIPNGWKVEILE